VSKLLESFPLIGQNCPKNVPEHDNSIMNSKSQVAYLNSRRAI
jgi:hypothetical protein